MRFFHNHNDTFDPSNKRVGGMIERSDYPKPSYGVSLWGSAMFSESTWMDWDSDWVYSRGDLEKFFCFEVDGNVLVIDSKEDWINFMSDSRFACLIDNRRIVGHVWKELVIDWEKFSQYYDAIYLTDKGFRETRNMNDGYGSAYSYPSTYSWDCSSIVVFNEKTVRVVEPSKEEFDWIQEKIEYCKSSYMDSRYYEQEELEDIN